MEHILNWGIDIILWLQKASPTLDFPFIVLTFMGNADFFIVLLPLVYWCIDRRMGVGLAILFLFSVYLNEMAKVLVGQPRPFVYDPRVVQIISAEGGGFPSGHTQQAVVVWGYLATRLQKPWAWTIAGLLMVLIPMSRIYLGVHFPTDLVGGYIIGGFLLLLYLWLESPLKKMLLKTGLNGQIVLAFLLPIMLVLIFSNCEKNVLSAMGVLMGLGIGFALERRWIGFKSHGVWWKRLLRFLVGIAIVAILRLGLGYVFANFSALNFYRFVRYAVIGLWGGFGAPWVFCRLRLAEKITYTEIR